MQTTNSSGIDGGDTHSNYCDDDYTPPAQRGVLFFSSVPRDMRPQEVRMHFGEYGTLLRHKFTPFPKRERRPGGPLLPLQFASGHLEFAAAADARRAAAAMNGAPVVCRRRRRCYGQLWTVRFLDGVTWDSLAEEREGERRGRRRREMEERMAERAMNEAYRAAVLRRNTERGKKRTRSECASEEKTSDGRCRAAKCDGKTTMKRHDNPSSASAASTSTATTTRITKKTRGKDTSVEVVKKKKEKGVI